jgi:hypothetical protein
MVIVCRKSVCNTATYFQTVTRVVPVHTIKANKYAKQRYGSAHS